MFGFLGPNGAGKTTTMRLLLDLIRPDRGTVSVLGLDPRADGVVLSLNPPFLVWLGRWRVDIRVCESCWVVRCLVEGRVRFDASHSWCLERVAA